LNIIFDVLEIQGPCMDLRTLVVVLALLAAKPYALAPAYPALFAGGVPTPGLLADCRDCH